jgi:DNA recombination protein RmuC
MITILTVFTALAAIAAAAAAVFVLTRRPQSDPTQQQIAELARLQSDATLQQIAELARLQAEASGRMQAMGEGLSSRQAELARVLAERLEALSSRMGQSMEATTQQTVERLRGLHERLAVIDSAQKNLSELSMQVTSLRDVLANKQTRGAFGQARLEAIVEDGMPKGAYEFQYTLSNRSRPDCVIFLPDKRPLIVDAKFPLEALTAYREAPSEEVRKVVAQRVRQDVGRHVVDIAEKYLIPGETQDLALMFVPSESVYADLHEGFDDVVQKAYRARVMLVSPSLLMLAIQVMQQILKDARMREAADLIRTEVTRMLDDVARLRERVLKLQQHFDNTSEDVRQILISSDKIEKRATRIEEFDFSESGRAADGGFIPAPEPRKLEAGE